MPPDEGPKSVELPEHIRAIIDAIPEAQLEAVKNQSWLVVNWIGGFKHNAIVVQAWRNLRQFFSTADFQILQQWLGVVTDVNNDFMLNGSGKIEDLRRKFGQLYKTVKNRIV